MALPAQVQASHSAGYEIWYEYIGQDGSGDDIYVFNVRFYRDCNGIASPSTVLLEFTSPSSCASDFNVSLPQISFQEVSLLCDAELANSTCNGCSEPGIEEYFYSDTITMPAECDDWLISYEHVARNAAITNLVNPGSEALFIELQMDNLNYENDSPFFSSLPTPYVCLGESYCYNHGATDPNGNVLRYSLINARTLGGANISYTGGFSPGYPISTTSGTFNIDANTGAMCFTPDALGQYVVTIEVEELDALGNVVGTTMRELQVIVQNCVNQQPELDGGLSSGIQNNGDGIVSATADLTLDACPGDNVDFDLVFDDPDVADILSISNNIATNLPGASTTVSGTNPLTLNVQWTPTGVDTGANTFTVFVEDNGCAVVGSNIYAVTIDIEDGVVASPDQGYCPAGGPVQLSATGGSGYTWSVVSGDFGSLSCTVCPSPSVAPAVTTVYRVTAGGALACNTSDEVTVSPASDFAVNPVTPLRVCSGSPATLDINPTPNGGGDPQTPYTYSWTPSADLDDPTIQDPTVDPVEESQVFTVRVTSAEGCVIEETVDMQVITFPSPVVTADNLNPECGSDVELFSTSTTEFESNFNTGFDAGFWNVTAGNNNTNCGAPDGSAGTLHFPNAPNTVRRAETADRDLTNCNEVSWCFILGDGSSSSCELIDANEGVVLEYSTDGGTSWTNLFDMSESNFGGSGWVCTEATLPSGAQTAATRFRFDQPNSSGSSSDAWAIDNFAVTCQTPGYTYSWSPTTGLNNPNISNPTANVTTPTTYTVTVSNTVQPPVCEATADITITPQPIQVEAIAIPENPICGEPVQLLATGTQPASDEFEESFDASVWADVQNGASGNDCSTPSGTGNALMFATSTDPNRRATTTDYDLTDCHEVSWCFYLGNGGSGCEAIDPGDGPVLEYSTDNGATWSNLFSMTDNAFGDAGWTCITQPLPVGAKTADTRLRFDQPVYSSGSSDVWGIDDFSIGCADEATLDYSWTPTTGLTPNASVSDPTVTAGSSPQTYDVLVTNTAFPGCNSIASVTITPRQLPMFVSADDINPVCGQDVQLFSTGTYGIEDDFENDFDASVWESVNLGAQGDGCGTAGAGSDMAFYFPLGTGAERNIATGDRDLSDCSEVSWCFYLGDGSSGCDSPEDGDGPVLQYSNDGGTTWNTFFTMDHPTYGNSGWTCVTEALPAAAQTASTRIRFDQPTFSNSASSDVWAFDNFQVGCADDAGLTYSWSPTTGLSDPTISNPTASLTTAETYTLTVSNPATAGCSRARDITITRVIFR